MYPQETEITTSLQTHPAKLLPDLDFADGIVLLDQDETVAIKHFQTIDSFEKKVGLNINYDKTKIMIRNVDNPRTEVIEGKLVMKVVENTALGVMISSILVLTLQTVMWTPSDAEDLHRASSGSDSLEIKGDLIVIKIMSV